MQKGLNCDRKSQLSEILTEPLNPRGVELVLWKKQLLNRINIYLQNTMIRADS